MKLEGSFKFIKVLSIPRFLQSNSSVKQPHQKQTTDVYGIRQVIFIGTFHF